MSAHRRRTRSTRPAVAGRAALAGAAVLGLGAGPLVGLASAAPTPHVTSGPSASAIDPTTSAGAATVGGDSVPGVGDDALWYGLLATAAVAGAAGAHQLTAGRPRRRA